MTWTVGYFCPSCELRYVKHLCKDGKLPCGCETKTTDAPFVFVWYKGYRGIEIHIFYKDFVFNGLIHKNFEEPEITKEYIYASTSEKLKTLFHDLVKNRDDELLLLKTFDNALHGQSLYYKDWWIRCDRCIHGLGWSGYYPHHGKYRCELHDFCTLDCKDFIKQIEIKEE